MINTTEFSYKLFARTYEEFRPKNFSRTQLKKELALKGILLTKYSKTTYFSEDEKEDVIQKWNSGEGKQFSDTIGRRPWYEKIEGKEQYDIKNEHPYRSLEMLAYLLLLRIIASPEGPDGAEWINYNNTPDKTRQLRANKEQGWTKVPGYTVNLFVQRYLKEDDYLILR